MGNEDKWKANLNKVAFLKSFPGCLSSWNEGIGATIEHVLPIPEHAPHTVLLLSQGRFAVTPPVHDEPRMMTAGLLAARPFLESIHPGAFEEYDRLTRLDQEAGRTARLENILNAIDNNLERIPELKSRIQALVKKWDKESHQSQ
jgi:diglucosylglycerate octanoyltransferase